MGISDYLAQVTKLTNTNIQLLKALNDSFNTDKNNISVTIDGSSYVIPSFISLENKLNNLQMDFENLVNAPETSEAYFAFDGDSRSIEVRKYEQAPNSLVLGNQDTFYHEENNVFKDFLTPVPYLKFDTSSIPNDVVSVDVRKVVAISDAAKEIFINELGENTTTQMNWGDLYKLLNNLQEGKDYIYYDTVKSLPIRSGLGSGNYVIKEVVKEEIDENLNQYYTVRLAGADAPEGYQKGLNYLLFDQTIEKRLEKEDYLVTWDGKTKFVIDNLNYNTLELRLWNVHNGFANITGTGDELTYIPDSSKLKFFMNYKEFKDDQYIKVPLEEDQYIYVAIAPLNSRMNIRAPWGVGVMVDTKKLKDEDNVNYEDYYKNCRNIGDILNEMSTVMSRSTTTSLSDDDIKRLQDAKIIGDEILNKVIKINGHLSDNKSMETIQSLYKSKQVLKTQLDQIQTKINEQQEIISTTNFQDTTGTRQTAENTLTELNKKKDDIINSLNSNMQAISQTAQNATIPIERAKYRIRGFVNYEAFEDRIKAEFGEDSWDHVKGVQIRYQYVNPRTESVGKATSFNEGEHNFLFSDWNDFKTPLRPTVKTDDGYALEENNDNKNEPSFNQFDIPITQGEVVNIKVRVIYDYGYPFVQLTSEWSDVLPVSFPEELIEDVDIVDMIEENNSDIENRRFETILEGHGVIKHVDDAIVDQDKTYFHNPDNIASGFYTEDNRRVVPLSAKLQEMNNNIATLLGEVAGDVSEQLEVTFEYGDSSSIILSPYNKGVATMKDLSEFDPSLLTTVNPLINIGNYVWQGMVNGSIISKPYVTNIAAINITNITDKVVNIYSLFPGETNMKLNTLQKHLFDPSSYCVPGESSEKGVYYKTYNENNIETLKLQQTNQIITFRIKNAYDGTEYYDAGSQWAAKNKLSLDKNYITMNQAQAHTQTPMGVIMDVYPVVYDEKTLFMTPEEAFSKKSINPGETLQIPIAIEYAGWNNIGANNHTINKTISFDLRTSLYKDPYTYSITISAGKDMTNVVPTYSNRTGTPYTPATKTTTWLERLFNNARVRLGMY